MGSCTAGGDGGRFGGAAASPSRDMMAEVPARAAGRTGEGRGLPFAALGTPARQTANGGEGDEGGGGCGLFWVDTGSVARMREAAGCIIGIWTEHAAGSRGSAYRPVLNIALILA